MNETTKSNREAPGQPAESSNEKHINPFENNQTVEKDIQQSKQDLDKEQQFKEAQTERD